MIDPLTRQTATMTRGGDYLTTSQIDLAWLLPLPTGLRGLLDQISNIDPCLVEHGLFFAELGVGVAA
jgi:hypothetical protein